MQSATRRKEVLVAKRVVSGQACTKSTTLLATNMAYIFSSNYHLVPVGKELLLERQVFCDCLNNQIGRGKGVVGARVSFF